MKRSDAIKKLFELLDKEHCREIHPETILSFVEKEIGMHPPGVVGWEMEDECCGGNCHNE